MDPARWILTALAVYAAAVAANRLLQAAAALLVLLLLAGYLTNPADPTALARAVWEAVRTPAERLAVLLLRLLATLWRQLLGSS